MSGTVGGAGSKGANEIAAGGVQGIGADAGASDGADAPVADGAPNAKRTARAKSLDMGSLGLAGALAAKLSQAGGASSASTTWTGTFDATVVGAAIEKAFPGLIAEPIDGPTELMLSDPKNPGNRATLQFAGDTMNMTPVGDGYAPGESAWLTLEKGDDLVAKLQELATKLDQGDVIRPATDSPTGPGVDSTGHQHGVDPLPPPKGGPRTPVKAGPIATPIGTDPGGPRPTSGAADAMAIEAAMKTGDASKVASELYARIGSLVTMDRREGIQVNPNATAGEIGRLKSMLDKLQADGKLGDLRKMVQAGQPRLAAGSVDGAMDTLIRAFGTDAQKAGWSGTPRVVGPAVATPVLTDPGGPRPTSGAADAMALEALMKTGDATKIAGELYARIGSLVTMDRREGIQVNQNNTAGEIGRLKSMLDRLQGDGKLGELRKALHGPSAGPRLQFGTVEDVMDTLVRAFGSDAEKASWAKAGK